ncbi:hypothetical protein JCGZ_00768 [Jatropha curcas]|uniref:RRM domain-containing protein n=1 Tax=Jatropha curcas TaxID=180498 RepID=A0A067KS09_JATCU|nr:glycine-rich RNA-binding protein 2 [Jatropha curcas]KDP39011.1 hypothetical protein JCGZ_00768 [Jatropha curcas]
MAMRARAALSAAAPRGLLRLFSTSSFSSFIPPQTKETPSARETAPPNCQLFVSGLNKRTTTEKLKESFSQFGEVVHAKVVTDRVSGYSKGFGFVRYATIEDAAKAIQGMDGKFLDGWVIFAEYSRPKQLPSGNAGPGYGSNGGPVYRSNTSAYGNNVGPSYGNTNSGPEYGNAAVPTYAGNMGPAHGSNMGPAYGHSTGPAYGSNTTSVYGNTTGPANWGNANSVRGNATTPAYESDKSPVYGSNTDPAYGNTVSPAYGSDTAHPYGDDRSVSYGRQ